MCLIYLFNRLLWKKQIFIIKKKYYNELIKKVVKILFLGSIIIVSFTPIIYRLFLKNDYWKGIDCVPVLLCGAVYLSLAQYVGDILLVKKKTLWIGGSTICAAICNVIVNIIIIPYAGISRGFNSNNV